MLEFIRLLKQRYHAVAAAQSGDGGRGGVYREYLEQLALADAFIGKGRLLHDLPAHAVQIAVIGPTQAGKSSLVNLLLHSSVAGVSPLAGYTVHPQGFCVGVAETQLAWLRPFFGDFRQVGQSDLRRDDYRMYSLTHLGDAAAGHLSPCVLWDTPDFDSIDAAGYREGVLKTIALADVIVLVVSKEKYADQSVWDIMTLLQTLNQPTLIVVNKLAEESQQTILNSLQEKWRQARQDDFPEVLPLLYRQQGLTAAEQQQARKKLDKVLSRINRRKHSAYEQQYLARHWPQWLEPVLAEHAALTEWRQLLDQAVKNGLSQYQRDFLDHPHYYETFQNALAELLTLLELPGIARVLAGTRRILTWPVRKVLRFGAAKRNGAALVDNSHEVALLRQLAEHQLIQLADKLLDKVEQASEQRQWWKMLGLSLRQRRGEILQSFGMGVAAYHSDFQRHVEAAAQHLYHKLQEQPLVLNGLRATRISTDAAAVALALHSGGIGLHDLVIAPAMLSVTSLLAESAIGGYMHKVEAELKQNQLAAVKQQLFERHFQALLARLPESMNDAALFNISEAQLADAEQHLKEKKHGLRLLGFS
jgi:GTP-binding protein EngB required for normal cell division